MAKTVVGLFNHLEDARGAVQDLIDNGIRRDDISLIAHDPDGENARQLGVAVENVGEDDAESDSGRSETATGASIGAAAGGVAGLLAGLGLLMIPGVGPVLAAGPLAAVLGGIGIGALAGGMIGALVEAGIPEDEANVFAEGVRRGNVLVMVNVEDVAADKVAEVMNRYHPVDLDRRGDEMRESKWRGFNEGAEPFAFDPGKPSYKEREPSSRLDYGPGARAYLRGQSVYAADREFAELGNYQNAQTGAWKTYESRFRADYQQHYAGTGRRWEEYREAYRFGFDAAQRAPYANSTWVQIEKEMREHWESQNMGLTWSDYEHAVQQGWEVGHTPS